MKKSNHDSEEKDEEVSSNSTSPTASPEEPEEPEEPEQKKSKPSVQLFLDEPDATEEALKTYVDLKENIHLSKNLANVPQDEVMPCDCKPIWKDGINLACDEDSHCINRMTSIECTDDACGHCRNQRFQNGETAPVDVIHAGKKGYGLRAKESIERGTFIYEYLGEIVDEGRFRKRMKQYEDMGIKHFYFMMIQKGEFVDATMKAGLGRFCNHSCRPNAYIEKWVVAGKYRMGIFAKRDIQKGEEVTFDYNVDRYGTAAQPCYCGESNCVGFLGGKTQTEAASKLPQLYIDALGLDGQDERNWVTTTAKIKKVKGKGSKLEIQESDYVDNLPTKPIADEESVSKVMSSLMQCQEEWLVEKLMDRIRCTDDSSIHLEVMTLHGYQILGTVLLDWKTSEPILRMVLEELASWPKVTKNKISSSRIEQTVRKLSEECEFENIKQASHQLLEEWSNLKMAYRIPRRERPVKSETPQTEATQISEAEEEKVEVKEESIPVQPKKFEDKGRRDSKPGSRKFDSPFSDMQNGGRRRNSGVFGQNARTRLPKGWDSAVAENGRVYYFNRDTNQTSWERPQSPPNSPRPIDDSKPQQDSLQKIIELASLEQKRIQEEKKRAEEEESAKKERHRSGSKEKPYGSSHHSKKSHDKKPSTKPQEVVEKGLTKKFASYVPNLIKKHEEEIGHENVKSCARDIVKILVTKELKRDNPMDYHNDFSTEKKAKIKQFAKEYMVKFLEKYRSKKRAKESSKLDNGPPAQKQKISHQGDHKNQDKNSKEQDDVAKMWPETAEVDLD